MPTPCGVPVKITVPGQKRCAAAEKFDERRHIENHVVGIPALNSVAVQDGFDRRDNLDSEFRRW